MYVESTIPSYVVARPARDILQAARQQLTQDWWERHRASHELFTSQVVLDEIAFGEAAMATRREDLMRRIPLLRVNDGAKGLARTILGSGLLPTIADRDAVHIALSCVYQMDILLTWNCRHIANATIQSRLRKLVRTEGLPLPEMCTPEELMCDE